MSRRSSQNLRYAEVIRIYRRRFGDEMPLADILDHIRKTLGSDLGKYSPAELGRLLQLTYEERKALGIRTVQCVELENLQRRGLVDRRSRPGSKFEYRRSRLTRPAVHAK